jgi:CPA2 family monovalent cation:H+ antiporter-2
VERGGEALMTPDVNVPFEEGDVVWVVGENEDVYRLIGQNCDRKR